MSISSRVNKLLCISKLEYYTVIKNEQTVAMCINMNDINVRLSGQTPHRRIHTLEFHLFES